MITMRYWMCNMNIDKIMNAMYNLRFIIKEETGEEGLIGLDLSFRFYDDFCRGLYEINRMQGRPSDFADLTLFGMKIKPRKYDE